MKAVAILLVVSALGCGGGTSTSDGAAATTGDGGVTSTVCTFHIQGDSASGVADTTYTTPSFASNTSVGCLYTQPGDGGPDLFQISLQASVGDLQSQIPLTITQSNVTPLAYLETAYHELQPPSHFWSCRGQAPAAAIGTFTLTVTSATPVPGDTNPAAHRLIAHGTLHAVCPGLSASSPGMVTIDASF